MSEAVLDLEGKSVVGIFKRRYQPAVVVVLLALCAIGSIGWSVAPSWVDARVDAAVNAKIVPLLLSVQAQVKSDHQTLQTVRDAVCDRASHPPPSCYTSP